MNLLFPTILLALISLLIPIALHLFNSRKHKEIAFSHSCFLEQLRVKSKKPSKIQKKILLAVRILLLSSLIFAFAQPFLKSDKAETAHIPILFLDQSPSMALSFDGQSLWSQAQREALSLLEQMKQDEEIIILSTEKPMAYQSLSKEDAIKKVKQMKPGSQFLSLSQLVQQISNTENELEQRGAPVYLFSNFQKSLWSKGINDRLHFDNPWHFLQYDFPETIKNAWIDTAYIERGTEEELLHFELALDRAEEEETAYELQLLINEQLYQTLHLEKEDDYKGTFVLPDLLASSTMKMVLQDHEVNFDDTLFMSYQQALHIPIAFVSSSNRLNHYLNVLQQSIPHVRIDLVKAHDKNTLDKYPLVIYEAGASSTVQEQDILKAYMQEGGHVLWLPSVDLGFEKAKVLLNDMAGLQVEAIEKTPLKVQRLERHHGIIQEMYEQVDKPSDLPTAYQYFVIPSGMQNKTRTIFTFQNGLPFLSEMPMQKGLLYIASTAMDPRASDWVQSYLFAPLIMVLAQQNQVDWPLYKYNQDDQALFVLEEHASANKEPWHIVGENTDWVPQQEAWRNGTQIYLPGYALNKGWYEVMKISDQDNKKILAYNLSKDFSHLHSMQKEDWDAIFDGEVDWKYMDTAQHPLSFSSSKSWKIWQYLVLFAILMLVLDALLVYRDRT